MTKARSKSQKLKAKKGRPMINGAREPSGRLSRSGIDHGPADVIALDARRRHLGKTEDRPGLVGDQVKDQKAGSFIGYLNLLGSIDGLSDDQYEAATQFLGLRTAYLRAIKAPGGVRDGEPVAQSGEVTEAYEDWVADTKESYASCRRAVQEAQNENRRSNLWAALDLCIIQDQRIYPLIGDLRVLCNALCRFFRVAK